MSARNASTDVAPSAAEPMLVMTHVFDAPRDLVYAAWTEDRHLKHWQGAPEGMTVTIEKAEIRPGGEFKLRMRAPDGAEHRLQGVYREVVPPERLVFTHAWLDASGKPDKETLVTITFVERGTRTELTLRQTGFKSERSRDGHEGGWGSTFTRLGDYLADLRATAPLGRAS
jgi:uncharacterized protein YndB with AHSA1/START domain